MQLQYFEGMDFQLIPTSQVNTLDGWPVPHKETCLKHNCSFIGAIVLQK